ncbi:MAG: Nre family DNA repair protein [Desulfurococcales archaeon]|nr:Nre family DNA repair protein [Desulfurococcales archaeon]
MPSINPKLCTICKGYKRLCGLPRCPILERFKWNVSATALISEEVEGQTPPSTLVGEFGYPKVRIYYAVPPDSDNPKLHDDPLTWSMKRFPLPKIVSLRASLVSGTLILDARNPEVLLDREIAFAAVSDRTVDSEVFLEKKPVPKLRFDGLTKPVGPSSKAREIKITGNPAPPRPLEKLVYDEVKAEQAAWILYTSGVDIYTITRAFSLGMLGLPKNRRLVPTRWSITAVDTLIAGRMLERVRRSKRTINSIEVYTSYYLGNKFVIILLPGPYKGDWIEAWQAGTLWTRGARRHIIITVHEDERGRQDKMDGGFMAARLPVIEHLYRRKARASFIILREIYPSYYAPVGNWHIRETVRRALASPPYKPETRKDLERYVSSQTRVGLELLEKSKVYREYFRVKRLDSFF